MQNLPGGIENLSVGKQNDKIPCQTEKSPTGDYPMEKAYRLKFFGKLNITD